MANQDPYKTLGISKSATQEEIKNAYRQLAKKHHPDLNPGSKAAEAKFKDISAAYELLETPEARAKYDRGEVDGSQEAANKRSSYQRQREPFYYEAHTQPGGGGGSRYSYSFGQDNEPLNEDLFESLFRTARAGSTQHPARGEDLSFALDINLKDAIHGTKREVKLPNGNRLEVTIPPGVRTGNKLRFAGQGAPGIQGGPAGDAYIEISVQPNDKFKTDGDQILIDLPISLYEAVLGGEVQVPTIDGNLIVKIPPGVNSGKKLRLNGQGLYDRKLKKRGDAIATLTVVLPSQMDPELLDAIKKAAERSPYVA